MFEMNTAAVKETLEGIWKQVQKAKEFCKDIPRAERMRDLEMIFTESLKTIETFAKHYRAWDPNKHLMQGGFVDFDTYQPPDLSYGDQLRIPAIEMSFSMAYNYVFAEHPDDRYPPEGQSEEWGQQMDRWIVASKLLAAMNSIVQFPKDGMTGRLCHEIDMHKTRDLIAWIGSQWGKRNIGKSNQ